MTLTIHREHHPIFAFKRAVASYRERESKREKLTYFGLSINYRPSNGLTLNISLILVYNLQIKLFDQTFGRSPEWCQKTFSAKFWKTFHGILWICTEILEVSCWAVLSYHEPIGSLNRISVWIIAVHWFQSTWRGSPPISWISGIRLERHNLVLIPFEDADPISALRDW